MHFRHRWIDRARLRRRLVAGFVTLETALARVRAESA
jgi:hypothetical protein